MKSNGTVRAATRFGALRTGKVESKNPRLTEAKSKRARTGALFHLSQSQSRRRVIWPHHRSQPRQYLARARTGCAQVLPRTHEVLQEPRAHFRAFARGRRRRSWCVSPRSIVAQPSPFLASDVCAGPIEPARTAKPDCPIPFFPPSQPSTRRMRPMPTSEYLSPVSNVLPSNIAPASPDPRARDRQGSGGEANFQDLLD